MVPIMHQVSSTSRSFTLSWPQPEQPNGIILEYELRYYEKVRPVSSLTLNQHPPTHTHVLNPKHLSKTHHTHTQV